MILDTREMVMVIQVTSKGGREIKALIIDEDYASSVALGSKFTLYGCH